MTVDRNIINDLDLQGHKAKNAADGTDPQDYATVAQLAAAGGLPDPSGEPDGQWLRTASGAAVWVAATASDIPFVPAGTISATDVQAAIEEVAAEAGGGAVSSVFTRTGAVVAATSDYDAVQVDFTPAGTIAATNTQAAVEEVAVDAASALSSEASTRASADSSEASTRASADSALTSAISSEASARAAADALLVAKSLFDANTILKADSDDTPTALTMGASTILARLAAGNIVAATPSELRTLLALVIGTNVEAWDADLDALADLNSATGKTTPVDADLLALADSAASFAIKKLTLTNFKAFLKTYFDTVYAAVGGGGPPTGAAGGDLTGTYPNPTLAAAGGGAAGPTGSATVIPIVTVDAKGRVTALSSATAAPTNAAGGDLTGNFPNPTLGSGAFATPAIVLGSAAAAGSTSDAIRSDSTIAAFDTTVPSTQAFGDAAAIGTAAFAARRDHKHAMMQPLIGTPELIYRYTVAGSDKASIDTGVDAADAGSNDWTAGDLLEVFFYSRTDEAVVGSGYVMTWNNTGTSVYDRAFQRDLNTTVSGGNTIGDTNQDFTTAGASEAAGVFGILSFVVPNYAGTTGNKAGIGNMVHPSQTAASITVLMTGQNFRSNSALTRIAFAPLTALKKFKVGTQLLIYKRRSS